MLISMQIGCAFIICWDIVWPFRAACATIAVMCTLIIVLALSDAMVSDAVHEVTLRNPEPSEA